jgi:hypothetical protein
MSGSDDEFVAADARHRVAFRAGTQPLRHVDQQAVPCGRLLMFLKRSGRQIAASRWRRRAKASPGDAVVEQGAGRPVRASKASWSSSASMRCGADVARDEEK